MRYLSVCAGIEAATVAWHHMGWQAAAYSEIDKFPSAVLKHHYPNVPNVGDMTKYKEWDIGAIDLLVGGTPCQSFSVAGLRKGMADPRGNLALVYCGILDHFRPKWFVWENVPGVLSSNGGRDFGSFLGALAELGYGFAYRVLDAQYFGVAQRRRRVFVVGHLGDWRRAAAVLFESQSLRRDTAPRRETGERIAPSISTGAPFSRTGNERVECDAIIPSWWDGKEIAETPTRTSDDQRMPDKNRFQAVIQPIPFGVSEQPNVGHCLRAGASKADKHESTTYVAQPVTYDLYNITAPVNGQNRTPGDPCHTLARANAQHAAWVHPNMAVRRLTPVECERLQGFPDNYTNIKENCPDGPRYKALGNSMAVPVMRWIGERINGQN